MNKWQIICPVVAVLLAAIVLGSVHSQSQRRVLVSAVTHQLDGHAPQIGDILATMRGSNVTVIEDVKQSDGGASGVAREHLRTGDIRKRYRLAASGASWKIIGLDQECFVCRGTGESGGSRCRKCNGEGWYDCFSNVV